MKKDLIKEHDEKGKSPHKINMVLKRNIILIVVAAIVILILGTGIIIFLATTNRSGSPKKSRIQMEDGATSGAPPEVGTTTRRATTPTMSSTTTSEALFSEVCVTEECVKLGASVRSHMNQSADPCEDFYEYVCGNYTNTKNLLDLFYGVTDDVLQLIKSLKNYKAETKSEKTFEYFMKKCIETKEDPDLDEGIWQSDDLTDLLNEMAKIEPIATGFIRNEVTIGAPGKLGAFFLYLKSGIEADSPFKNVSDTIYLSNPLFANATPVYAHDLSSVITFMNLTKYYINLLPEENRNEHSDWILGAYLNELYLLQNLVDNVGVEKIKQYLHVTWKKKLKRFIVQETEPFFACLSKAVSLFPGTLGMLLVKQFVNPKNIEKSNMIIDDLKIAFEEMLDENTWLNEHLKSVLKEEAKTIQSSIGIPDEHKDVSNMDRMYARIEKEQKVEDQSYLTLVRNIIKMNSEETFLRVARRETTTFATNTLQFAANFSPFAHRISASPILIKFPYIDPNLPEWTTIASFGFVIAHEMGHAFDTVNFIYNSSVMPIAITEIEYNEFNRRIDCISKKYDKFQFTDGTFSSGERTKQEDSADMIGFNLAYRLFKKLSKKQQKLPGFENQTMEQNYFQRMANVWCKEELEGSFLSIVKQDTHSAHKFRVNGMMSNSVEFARAFGCEKGSPMNPEKKCPLFK